MMLFLMLLIAQDEVVVETKKYADHAEVQAFIKRLPEVKAAAFKRICDALGVSGIDPKSVSIRVADAVPDSAKLSIQDGIAMETSSADGKAHIDIFAEYLAVGAEDNDRRLLHEMVHAVMRLDLGKRYSDLPKWFREGVAVHLAGQTRAKMEYLLMDHVYAEHPEKLVHGLEGEHKLDDYAEDGLAVEYLAERISPTECEKSLRTGKSLKEIVGAEFEKGAREHALKAIEARVDESMREYVAILGLWRSGKPTNVIEACDTFLKERAKSFAASPVKFYRARALYDLQRFEEAIVGFQEFRVGIGGGKGMTGLLDESKMYEALACREVGKLDRATTCLVEIVRDHVDSNQLQEAAYLLGFTLYDRGRVEEAKRVLRRALESFPKDGSAKKARALAEK